MFTVLAGAMMTVSATALGVCFNFSMPQLTDTLPTGAGWVVAVLATGVLFSVVAAYGYRFVSRFANIAAPWMVLVFVAFGIIGLRQMGLKSLGDFWHVASTVIWTGGAPHARPGQVHLLARHVLRLVLQHGLAHRHGRPLGLPLRAEILVWPGVGRGDVYRPFHGLDRGLRSLRRPTPSGPGQHRRAARTAGLSRLRRGRAARVVAAGWTTANPTLYRAGLAFQSLIPGPPASRSR